MHGLNLEDDVTHAQLAKLIASIDPNAGRHILWIDRRANVHISRLAEVVTAAMFEAMTLNMKARIETFPAGSKWLGVDASNDADRVGKLYDALLGCWGVVQRSNKTTVLRWHLRLDD